MAPARKPAGRAQGHRAQLAVRLGAAVEAPDPPGGLLKVSRERWEAFWASDVARAVDVAVDGQRLHRWISYVDEWHRAIRAFRRKRVTVGSMGQPVLHPLAGYLAQLEQSIARAETEFGLTPLARMKLGIATGEAAMSAERLNAMTREAVSDAGEAVDAEYEAV